MATNRLITDFSLPLLCWLRVIVSSWLISHKFEVAHPMVTSLKESPWAKIKETNIDYLTYWPPRFDSCWPSPTVGLVKFSKSTYKIKRQSRYNWQGERTQREYRKYCQVVIASCSDWNNTSEEKNFWINQNKNSSQTDSGSRRNNEQGARYSELIASPTRLDYSVSQLPKQTPSSIGLALSMIAIAIVTFLLQFRSWQLLPAILFIVKERIQTAS